MHLFNLNDTDGTASIISVGVLCVTNMCNEKYYTKNSNFVNFLCVKI